MKDSAIQWCDHTFNPWEGCAKVAPECKNCYAEVLVDHRFGRVKWGKGQPRRRTSEGTWKQPLRWNREPRMEFEHRRRVFCLSLGDWLDEEVPIEWLADLLELIHNTPNLDWLLLTKRPQNWRERMSQVFNHVFQDDLDNDGNLFPHRISAWFQADSAPDNVWIGVSAGADQRAALDIPAKVHFLSCEPMLKPLELAKCPRDHNGDGDCDRHRAGCPKFDWIIFGGESGKNARPCDVNWIRDGVAFCRRNGIAPFVKQLGAKPVYQRSERGGPLHDVVRKLNDSHGGDMSEWPEDLRVREFPKAA